MKRPVRGADGKYHVHGKTYKELFGSRQQVHNQTAYKTHGGLTKSDLMMNKWGRIVSAKKHRTAKKEKRLEKAGYFAKKGKFGYVKKGAKTRKARGSRKMRGGAACGEEGVTNDEEGNPCPEDGEDKSPPPV
jgi:DVNP family